MATSRFLPAICELFSLGEVMRQDDVLNSELQMLNVSWWVKTREEMATMSGNPPIS